METTDVMTVAGLLAFGAMLSFGFSEKDGVEHFTATGWVYNHPPNWWMPQTYTPASWLTPYTPDQLQYASGCAPNLDRGSPGNLNFSSSSYRFWRM